MGQNKGNKMSEKEQTKKTIMKKTGYPFQQEDAKCGEWCELFVQEHNQNGNDTGNCVFYKLMNTLADLPYYISQWAMNR